MIIFNVHQSSKKRKENPAVRYKYVWLSSTYILYNMLHTLFFSFLFCRPFTVERESSLFRFVWFIRTRTSLLGGGSPSTQYRMEAVCLFIFIWSFVAFLWLHDYSWCNIRKDRAAAYIGRPHVKLVEKTCAAGFFCLEDTNTHPLDDVDFNPKAQLV